MWAWLYRLLERFEDDNEGRIEYGSISGYGTYVDLERKFPMANEPDPQSPPHTHDWDVWEIVKEGEITRYNSNTWTDDTLGTYIDQRRRCRTCGKHELDTQVSYAVDPE